MNPEEIRKELRRQPFQPLRVYLTDGKTYDIRHPELAMLTRSTILLGFSKQPESGVVDDYDIVSLLHVVRIEKVEGQTASSAG